jgi:tRNA dimethylallyltransferase
MDQTLPGHSVVAIAGPTGSGKSELALHVATALDGEIVNCDSLQIYRWFNIGTAKVPEGERRGIRHHLIDIADPDEIFTAGEFAKRGRAVLAEIVGRGRLPLVVGGTGFYLRALIDGLAPAPSRDEALRERLANREGRRPGSLHRILQRLDPVTAARIHARDIPKVTRALEICLLTRSSASRLFETARDALQGFRTLKVGLFPPREELYQKLESRCEAMFAAGLIEETRGILARGFSPDAKPFESLGYRHALQVIRGESSLEEALLRTKQDTRRYAKRQMTWFRRESGLETFSGFGDDAAVQIAVLERVRRFLKDGS